MTALFRGIIHAYLPDVGVSSGAPLEERFRGLVTALLNQIAKTRSNPGEGKKKRCSTGH
jgi:hypothetical protein